MTTSSSRPGGTHLAGEGAPRSGRRDQGSAATELTIWTPLLILILLFVVSCGRLVQAQLRLSDAAHSASRAASLARDPVSASRAATAAVQAALPGGGATCTHADVSVDTSTFVPGGSVTVRVTCSVKLGDLTPLSLPAGTGTQSTSFTSVIDTFRGVSPAGSS
jgi:Flp pilus assembly protein TadG